MDKPDTGLDTGHWGTMWDRFSIYATQWDTIYTEQVETVQCYRSGVLHKYAVLRVGECDCRVGDIVKLTAPYIT